MSRIVRTGTQKKLYRLRERDLPDDHDLRGSCLTWCDLTDPKVRDLSAYNCELMDIHDSDCQGVILPDSVDFTVSLRSDWAGATIPRSLPFCGWSLVNEVLRRHTAPSGSREAEMIEWVDALIANAHEDVRNPWLVSANRFKEHYGMTADEIYGVFSTYAFGEYANLLRVLRWCVDAPPSAVNTQPESFMRVINPEDPEGSLWVPHDQIRVLGTEDRWAAARMAEQYLDQCFGPPGWQVMVFFLVPHVWAVALHGSQMTEPFEWWRALWLSTAA